MAKMSMKMSMKKMAAATPEPAATVKMASTMKMKKMPAMKASTPMVSAPKSAMESTVSKHFAKNSEKNYYIIRNVKGMMDDYSNKAFSPMTYHCELMGTFHTFADAVQRQCAVSGKATIYVDCRGLGFFDVARLLSGSPPGCSSDTLYKDMAWAVLDLADSHIDLNIVVMSDSMLFRNKLAWANPTARVNKKGVKITVASGGNDTTKEKGMGL